MLIDIHVHTARITGLGRPNGSRFPSPAELVAMMDAAGTDKAVVMTTISPECRYGFVTCEEVLGICAEYPDRLIPFANVDPRMLTNSTDSNFGPLLQHYKGLGCKGVGEYMANLPLDDPRNMNVFSHVEAIGFPLTFHLAAKIGGTYGCYDELGLPRLEAVLRAFPDLVLLGHSQVFWAELGDDVTEENRTAYPTGPVRPGRVVELMRTYPNLHGDLSAGSGYNAISRDHEFGISFLNEFQDRLYFATDIASVGQDLPLAGYLQALARDGTLSQSVYDKIAWQNATRLLDL